MVGKSTGPRTKAGKARAKMNALKFGMYAGDVVLPGEDRGAFNELKSSLEKTFRPQDPIAWTYVAQIAGHITRLKRVDLAEYTFYLQKILNKPADKGGPLEWLLGEIFNASFSDSSDYRDERLRHRRKILLKDLQRDIVALTQWQRGQALELRPQSPRRLKGCGQLIEASEGEATPKDGFISDASKADDDNGN